MISCGKGNTNFEGDEMELITDLGAIMYDLLNTREITVGSMRYGCMGRFHYQNY